MLSNPSQTQMLCRDGACTWDIVRAGIWPGPVRNISSGDLNTKKACKFLHQIWGKCTFQVAYNLIKPGDIFHRGGKKTPLIEKQQFPIEFWISITKHRKAWKWKHSKITKTLTKFLKILNLFELSLKNKNKNSGLNFSLYLPYGRRHTALNISAHMVELWECNN